MTFLNKAKFGGIKFLFNLNTNFCRNLFFFRFKPGQNYRLLYVIAFDVLFVPAWRRCCDEAWLSECDSQLCVESGVERVGFARIFIARIHRWVDYFLKRYFEVSTDAIVITCCSQASCSNHTTFPRSSSSFSCSTVRSPLIGSWITSCTSKSAIRKRTR